MHTLFAENVQILLRFPRHSSHCKSVIFNNSYDATLEESEFHFTLHCLVVLSRPGVLGQTEDIWRMDGGESVWVSPRLARPQRGLRCDVMCPHHHPANTESILALDCGLIQFVYPPFIVFKSIQVFVLYRFYWLLITVAVQHLAVKFLQFNM